jgi:SNF2 family DNA or RNA helicase
LGRYISHYRTKYFIQSGFGGYQWKPQPEAEARIHKSIGDICLRMSNEEYLQLPELVKTTVEITLGKQARALYDEMEKEFLLELKEGTVDAVNAAVLSGKLRQIINGAVYAEERTVMRLHDDKLDALDDLLEEIGAPTIVAYEFQHDRDRILERHPNAGVLGGGVAAKKADQLIRDWNAGEIPLLLVHPAAAGHGLNLQAGGHHIIWFGLTWNLEHYLQLIARLWRQGQEQRVFVYHLLARDTLDEVVWGTLGRKDASQQQLLDHLKKWRRKS